MKASRSSKLPLEFANGCILGKHPEHKFDWGKASRASEILGLIHSNISGPIPITSFNGSRYVLNFIDDFSRYTWAFFLKKKLDVLKKFIELKSLIENASGKKIKTLRSDNVGEYVSNEFLQLCFDSGVQIQHSVPYTPQQNDVGKEKESISQGDDHMHARSQEVGCKFMG